MCENKSDNDTNIASGNKLASDNNTKVSLINIENYFKGLEKAVALFFPSMRHEMLLRYRAETIAKIGLEAYKLTQKEDIKIKPIPPKIVMPIIEKMSLEHEETMYERWAKLLIAAGVNPNPIHQQYAEILSSLDSKSANLLREIFKKQKEQNIENEYEGYVRRNNFLWENLNLEFKKSGFFNGIKEIKIPPYFENNVDFSFPYYMTGNVKINGDNEMNNNEENMVMVLQRLGLIKFKKYYDGFDGENKDLDKTYKYGIFLTRFGHIFVDCLENPTGKNDK